MKSKVKEMIARLGVILVLVIFLTAGTQMQADAGFGDFNDYDYDSGSDWGSDWDSDWDSGWDDDDWSSSYSGGSSSYGKGEKAFVTILSWIIVIAIIYYTKRSARHRTQSSLPRQRRTVQPQRKVLPDRTVQISKVIHEHDPLFTAPDFISFAKQVYVDIQDAWSKRDLEPVRAVLHQNLYQQTERQIQKKIEDGIVNHLERISVNTAYLTSYRRDVQYEYLTVYMAASMIDYQVKEATGEVILGDKTTRWNMYYKMTFMRSNDCKTGSAKEKDKGFVCPNCGAPLTGTSFGKCEYCDSIVTTGIYDWVLSDFGVVKNDTRDDGIVIDS